MPAPSIFRRMLQFNLRCLLALPLITALAAMWWTWDSRPAYDPQMQTLATDWDAGAGTRIKWSMKLGSVAHGGVPLGDGKVFVGTNNAAGYVKRFPAKLDKGVLLCFDQKNGAFLWQATSDKLAAGRAQDWPQQGVCSTPHVQGDRLWYVTNRCEVVCLDTRGFHDGVNDGPYKTEPNNSTREADIVWKFDMIGKLGVSPHNMSNCNVVAVGGRLFVVTSNGVGPSHLTVTNPAAPSFICLDTNTGKLLWQDNSPGANVLHGQWGSPTFAMIHGNPQILFPGGDGWLYSFDPRGNGKGGSRLLWKFDCNPKTSVWNLSGAGSRNNLIGAPLVYDNKVYIATGQEPEHGDGPAVLWCIDPTGSGDVSFETVTNLSATVPASARRVQAADPTRGDLIKRNPNSKMIWRFDAHDTNGNGRLEYEEHMHRTIGRIRIKDDILVVADAGGGLHCLNAQTGVPHWHYDLLSNTWSSVLIAGKHFYIADEDGDVAIFGLSPDPSKAMRNGAPLNEVVMPRTIAATPAAENDVLFIATQRTLYAIEK